MNIVKVFTVFLLIFLWCVVISSSAEESDEIEDDTERLEKLQIAGLALAKSFAAVLGVANPIAGAVVAVGIEVLEPILDALQGEQDVWDQIESQVNQRIGEKLSESEISGYRDLLFDFNRRINKGARFAVSDLDYIIGKMEAVIPFDHTLGWNYDLPLMMVLYIPYLIASYQEILKKDKDLPVCALANDMNLYRSKVILGCKEMMKKRYKMIVAKTWRRKASKCKKKTFKRFLRRITKRNGHFGVVESDRPCLEYQQIYRDGVNGKLYRMRKLKGRARGDSWERMILKQVRRPTVNFLFKNIIEKINKYFTSDICLKSQYNCLCPEPIRREEISFGWPRGCYGLDRCLFPAGKFSKSYSWCYVKGTRKNWEYSDRIDLDTCMPVSRPTVEPLNVLN